MKFNINFAQIEEINHYSNLKEGDVGGGVFPSILHEEFCDWVLE